MKPLMKALSLLTFVASISGCSLISTTMLIYGGLSEPTDEISDLMREYDKNLNELYAGSEFHNVTLKSMKKNYKIYKYKESAMTFLEYQNTIYQLGVNYINPGYGVAQIGYLKVDSDADVYFTFCFYKDEAKYTGIGRFSTKDKKVTYLKNAIKSEDDYAFKSISAASSNAKINLFKVEMNWVNYPYTSNCNYSTNYSVMSGIEYADFQNELPIEA